MPLPVEERDAIYRAALDLLSLREAALADLTRRGLTAAAVRALRYRSIPRRGLAMRTFLKALIAQFGESRLRCCPGFADKNGRLTFWSGYWGRDGYVVPYCDEKGRITGLQLRLSDGRYQTARATRLVGMYHVAGGVAPGVDLYLTEGATKANVAHALAELTVFAVAGQALQLEHIATIASLCPGRVIVALDQEDNLNTARARERWIERLQAAGLEPWLAVWEGADVGGPKGLDDLVAAGHSPRLRPVFAVPLALCQPRVPHLTKEPGPVDGGLTQAEAFALTRGAVERFIARAGPGEAQLVASAPGTGKTTTVARALRGYGAVVRVAVGTHRLAQELAVAHGYSLIEGRNRGNCERMEVVEALAEAGRAVGKLACGSRSEPRCSLRAACAYWAQYERPGPWVGAAEQIFNPAFLRYGTLLVIDDADMIRALVERVHLSLGALHRAARQLAHSHHEPLWRLLVLVAHAATDAPIHPLLGPAVWDHLAKTAARYGEDFGALIRVLPRHPSVPELAARGVLTEADVRAVPPATVLRIVKALQAELPAFESDEPFNSCLRLHADGIDVWTLREHVRDRRHGAFVQEMALLVLDATPVAALVDHLTAGHRRWPDTTAAVRLPDGVTVAQCARGGNGHGALRDAGQQEAVLEEVAAERRRWPVDPPTAEAAIGYRALRRPLIELGFGPGQVLHFGNVRGSNALAAVRRLHVIGRPMPPSEEIWHLAQVIHHGEPAVSAQLILRSAAYGGYRIALDVVDFADPRAATLLRAHREDEIWQVIHRARLFDLEPQLRLEGPVRAEVRLVLHTNHPVPGLRVDELRLAATAPDVNAERAREAAKRIRAAAAGLKAAGEWPTLASIAAEAGSSKSTVAKVMRTPVQAPKRDLLNKGPYHGPQPSPSSTPGASVTYIEEV